MSTARQILDRTSIVEVWHALGGGPLRHHRGVAWWRDGDGYSVSLNQDKNVFFDFVTGEGGGILDLVRAANGCDRREALAWLARQLGAELDDRRPLTRAEKREYAQRRRHAEFQAQDLTDWRRDTLRRLRGERNPLYESENLACAVARVLLATGDGSSDENAWREIWKYAHDDLRAEEIDRRVQRIENATPGELVAMRQGFSEAA